MKYFSFIWRSFLLVLTSSNNSSPLDMVIHEFPVTIIWIVNNKSVNRYQVSNIIQVEDTIQDQSINEIT